MTNIATLRTLDTSGYTTQNAVNVTELVNNDGTETTSPTPEPSTTRSGPWKVPTGGTSGQVLTKDSDANFDFGWDDATGGSVLTLADSDPIPDGTPAGTVIVRYTATP
jgi:hypothetical protein